MYAAISAILGYSRSLDDDTGLVMIMNVEFANRTSDATTRRVWYKIRGVRIPSC